MHLGLALKGYYGLQHIATKVPWHHGTDATRGQSGRHAFRLCTAHMPVFDETPGRPHEEIRTVPEWVGLRFDNLTSTMF